MAGFTGRRRQRQTSRAIAWADFSSRWIITLGGIGTIGSVLLVAAFLFWVVYPLFLPARVSDAQTIAAPWQTRRPVFVESDESRQLAWTLFDDATLRLFRLSDGQVLSERPLFDAGVKPTAWSFSPGLTDAAFGFADGSARLVRIGFGLLFLSPDEVPAEAIALELGQSTTAQYRGQPGLFERIAEDQFRYVSLDVSLGEPVETGSTTPIVCIDHSVSPTATRLVALHQDGELFIEELRQRRNILTGKVTTTVSKQQIAYEPPAGRGKPDYLKLTGLGDNVLALWRDGLLQRYDVRSLKSTRLVEELRVVTQPDAQLTAVGFLLGKATLVVGDSQGNLDIWFLIRPDDAVGTPDGATLVNAARLYEGQGAAVTTIAPSSRGRMLAFGLSDGTVHMVHATSGKRVADLKLEGQATVEQLAIAPKADGLIAAAGGQLMTWHLDPGHPAATFGALFQPIWYESAPAPAHVWQSTGGTDDFEEKFGLYPLIFGTIKATIYSLLFGVPIALLAAVYTSEFMHPRVKARVKPTIEMMASLPSVVLGFLAGLVVAPFVENIIPAVIALFYCLPLVFLIGAYLWQLLPQHVSIRLAQWRFIFILLVLPTALLVAKFAGPAMEHYLFAGDFRLWLDANRNSERFGSSFGGWFLFLLPLVAILVALLISWFLNPFMREHTEGLTRTPLALLDGGKFLLALLATALLSALLAGALNAAGIDLRGSFVGTYVQRNALVVGFIMGFAIIPIIYTIAEDALSTVPQHLRSASLGAGATPWQTAVRIIIPTAMSGLFSAMMIGLGRAVGETMIVLMAAGNTPVLDLNIFNGFRTLSANIAVELPEAVKDSTHYRTLYLAALVLFIMTFVLNTMAESVRQRFRKKAIQL